jgi:hypothetical protein
VNVAIEETRQDRLPGAVDYLVAIESCTHIDDAVAFDDDISGRRTGPRTVDDETSAEDRAHHTPILARYHPPRAGTNGKRGWGGTC